MRVQEQPIKPAREIRVGDLVQTRTGDLQRTVRVTALLEHRIGAALVPHYLEDLTPPEEYEKHRRRLEESGARRDPGAGRPTKRDRRLLAAFLDLPASE